MNKFFSNDRVRIIGGTKVNLGRIGIVTRWLQGNKNGEHYEVRVGNGICIYRDDELEKANRVFSFQDLCAFLPEDFNWFNPIHTLDFTDIANRINDHFTDFENEIIQKCIDACEDVKSTTTTNSHGYGAWACEEALTKLLRTK